MINIRYYFSTYVLLWYFLYILNILPFNPVIFFYFILFFILLIVFYMIYLKLSLKKIFFFIIICIIIFKIIPILTLKHTFNPNDILFGFFIYTLYHIILYLTINVEPIQHYLNFINYYKNLPNNLNIIFDKITL
jgi:hypothetical protein